MLRKEERHDLGPVVWLLLLVAALVNGGGGCTFPLPLAALSPQGGPDGGWEGMGAEMGLDSACRCVEDLFSLLTIGGLSVCKVI